MTTDEFIIASGLGYCEGRAIECLLTWHAKGDEAELRRAKHYIEMLLYAQQAKAVPVGVTTVDALDSIQRASTSSAAWRARNS